MNLEAPELDAATADTIAGEVSRASRHALPLGTPCPNCGTPLKGPWCHACGQKGEEYQRSIWHLIAEAFEGVTHMDGRVWKTLPRLVFRPAQLTRDYLDGHRAAQIPPFRLFLVALLLVFFAGGLNFNAHRPNLIRKPPGDPSLQFNSSDGTTADVQKTAGAIKRDPGRSARSVWIRSHVQRAVKNPDRYLAALNEWGHRLAILLLPIAALMLTVLFAFKKGVYVFDHLIFSMHSLSFQGLLLSVIFLGAMAWDGAWQLLWLAPVHLFVHMRGAYRISVIGTLLRMFALWIASLVAVTFLLAGVILIGLVTTH